MDGQLIFGLLNDKIKIADLGCGVLPQYFYSNDLNIDCYDKYADNNFKNFYKRDILKLHEDNKLLKRYDLCIANHIFEHVNNVSDMFKTLHHILKPKGVLYCSIPDGDGITDIIYRLIHYYDAGGHINKWNKDEFIQLMADNNFELIAFDTWADDFSWLDKCYDLEYNKRLISQAEKHKLAMALCKEFTAEKNYYYGYEYIFRKV